MTLYGGGQYKLYTYRKYSDVRIVWAPEAKAPQFGGDPDNFNFPRYALDAAFLRAYEDGKPVATPQHLDLVAARRRSRARRRSSSATPARPSGLLTQDQLAFAKEVSAPLNVALYSELRGRLIAAMQQSPARAREGKEELDGVENSLKVYIGRVKAFNDPAFMGKLAAAEAELRAKSAGNPAIGDPWADIARATAAYREALPALSLHPAVGRPLWLCRGARPRRGGADQAQCRAPAGLQRQRLAAARKAGARSPSRSSPGSTSSSSNGA